MTAYSNTSGNSGIGSTPGPSTTAVTAGAGQGGNSSMQNMSGSSGVMGRDCNCDGGDTLNAGEVAPCNSDRNTGIGDLPMRTREHF